MAHNSSLNELYLDVARLNDAELGNGLDSDSQGKLNKSTANCDESMMMSTSVYDEKTGMKQEEKAAQENQQSSSQTNNNANKFNSFPMRQKKSKLKQAPMSTSALQHGNTNHRMLLSISATSGQSQHPLVTLSQEELELNVRAARYRSQENERLKQLIRANCWPIRHPIRRYLWKCVLQVSRTGNKSGAASSGDEANTSLNNKENQIKIELLANEADYNRHLDRIFGKSREIDVPLPEFVSPDGHTHHQSHTNLNNNNTTMNSTSSTSSSKSHLNYYFLNMKGREAVKRVLCVYEYHYPQVTYNPLLVSVASILLHYMQEHEVFAALCVMSSSKDHFLESKSSWETSTAVFIKLLKTYCKSSYEVITKYATDSLEVIFEQWIWWIFDSLSFDFLVKIMDCYIFEGQKVLYRVSLSIVQHFSKILFFTGSVKNPIIDAKHENVKVNKESIKNYCNLAFGLESIEKLLKTSFSIRNLKRSVIKEFFAKEEAKRKQQLADGSATLNSVNKTNGETNQTIPNQNSPSRIFVNETTTSILSHANLCTIWNWLPQRLSVYSPSMLFTTQEDGTSFNTLFNILDDLEYSLIVIKTFENEVFGAFCAGYWSQRHENQLYFGTGETFLFTISPEKKCFKWVGSKRESTSTSQEMFLRVDNTKISIGGGGGVGLTIASNLIEGSTARCETFENDPLASSYNFQISILEVIGFISMNG